MTSARAGAFAMVSLVHHKGTLGSVKLFGAEGVHQLRRNVVRSGRSRNEADVQRADRATRRARR